MNHQYLRGTLALFSNCDLQGYYYYYFNHIEFSRWQSTKLAARPIADSRYIHPIAQAPGVRAEQVTPQRFIKINLSALSGRQKNNENIF